MDQMLQADVESEGNEMLAQGGCMNAGHAKGAGKKKGGKKRPKDKNNDTQEEDGGQHLSVEHLLRAQVSSEANESQQQGPLGNDGDESRSRRSHHSSRFRN
jgi:hypothetical protein